MSFSRSNSKRFESSEINSNPQQQSPNNCEYERRLRLSRQADWSWLDACIGVVEGDPNPVEAYLNSGGNPARFLTPNEIAILNRPSAFDAGHTLVHLAIRFVFFFVHSFNNCRLFEKNQPMKICL